MATTLSGIVTWSENRPGAGRSHAIGMRPRWVTTTPDTRIGVIARRLHVDPGRRPARSTVTPSTSSCMIVSTLEPNPCDSLSPVWRASQLSHV